MSEVTIEELVEALRYIGLIEEADALEQTGALDSIEWGLVDAGTT